MKNHRRAQRRLPAISVTLALLASVGPSAAATLTWQTPGAGDWFDGGNWDAGGAFPVAGDLAQILNGGSATAAASIEATALLVGTTSNTSPAAGELTVSAGNLVLNGALSVGNANGPGATGTGAVGNVSVDGAISGVNGAFLLGSNNGAGSVAEGTISAASLAGNSTFFAVGRDDAGGSGSGTLLLDGALGLASTLSFFEVGYTFGAGEQAHGELRATSGDVSTGFALIGAHQGSQAMPGDVSGVADLGSGSLTSATNQGLVVGQLLNDRTGTAVGELSVAGLSGFASQVVGDAGANTSGSATGTLNVGSGGINGGSMSIGSGFGAADTTGTVSSDSSVTLAGGLTLGKANNIGAAAGGLTVTSGDLTLNGLLDVGNTGINGDGTSAIGSLAVDGAISGADNVLFLGSNRGVGSAAQGTISAASYTGAHTVFYVGRDDAGGNGTGAMLLDGALNLSTKVQFLEVGYTFGAGEQAHGQLRAASGDVLTGFTFIGAHQGSLTETGDVSGFADLGSGRVSSDQGGSLAIGQLLGDRTGTALGELRVAGVSGFAAQLIGTADAGDAGSATGTLLVGSDGISGGSLRIGTTGGGADATGTVVVDGAVDLNGGLDVGTNGGDSDSAADGSLDIIDGDLHVDGFVTVGQLSGTAGPKSASGSLDVRNGELTAGFVRVGLAQGVGSTEGMARFDGVTGQIQALQLGLSLNADGAVQGRAELVGTVLDVEQFLSVGLDLGGTGDGTLALVDSRMNVGVGTDTGGLFGRGFFGTGVNGNSQLLLERSILDVTRRVDFGAGSQLGIFIDGATRIDEYGAIDAEQVFLDGALQITFDFMPVLDTMVFDLIVSELFDGITGDFDSVDIVGLDPAYSAMTGIELDMVGGDQAEVYRLRITRNGVPVPGTLLLFVGALLGAAAVRRGRAQFVLK